VFLDPFGASVEYKVIEAIADTNAVDLWILFPYGTINRKLAVPFTGPAPVDKGCGRPVRLSLEERGRDRNHSYQSEK